MKLVLPSKVAILKQLKQHRKNIVTVHNNHMKKLDETIEHLEKEINIPEKNNILNTKYYSLRQTA